MTQPRTVITGVGHAGQVGEAVAQAFLAAGHHIWIVDRSADHVAERATALGGTTRGVSSSACDLTDASAVARLASAVAKQWPDGIDALVNVAGGFAMSGKVAESDLDVWNRQFAINLTTAYLATRAFVPQLRARRGAIVYFAAAAAIPGAAAAEMSAYVAAKAGVIALMRAVAQEEAGTVRANALAPTAMRTASNVAAMGDSAKFVTRESVADAVLFLCSDKARAISGQVIPVG